MKKDAWSSRGDGDLFGRGFEGLELLSEVRGLEDESESSEKGAGDFGQLRVEKRVDTAREEDEQVVLRPEVDFCEVLWC